MKNFLSIVLIASGMMAIVLSFLCLAAYPSAIGLLKLTSSQSLRESVVLFGAVLIPAGIFQVIAAYWVFKLKREGIILARICGIILIATGTIITILIKRPDLGLPDLVKGILITILVFLVPKGNFRPANG